MKTKVNEIFIMRAFASSSVVLLHSIGIIQTTYELSPMASDIFRVLQLLLLYSTPMFVFISEFVLSYSYGSTLPKGFFLKRFKLILVPYIFFGSFYALVWAYSYSITDINSVLYQMFLFVFRGDYHGYFVLIIFQFYILHKFLASTLDRLPIKMTLIISLLFNIGYLAFFNYTVWYNYASIPFARYIWTRGYFMFFPAWIFYFLLAYYSGKNMDTFYSVARSYKWLIAPLTLIFGMVILFQYKYSLLTVISTKRPDIVPYTLMVILLAFYLASFFKRVPRTINVINRCSYGVYLIHIFIQQILQNLILKSKYNIDPILAFLGVFIVSLFVSVFITIFVNKLPYGSYFVGKLGPNGIEGSATTPFYPRNIYTNLVKNILPRKDEYKKASKEL